MAWGDTSNVGDPWPEYTRDEENTTGKGTPSGIVEALWQAGKTWTASKHHKVGRGINRQGARSSIVVPKD